MNETDRAGHIAELEARVAELEAQVDVGNEIYKRLLIRVDTLRSERRGLLGLVRARLEGNDPPSKLSLLELADQVAERAKAAERKQLVERQALEARVTELAAALENYRCDHDGEAWDSSAGAQSICRCATCQRATATLATDTQRLLAERQEADRAVGTLKQLLDAVPCKACDHLHSHDPQVPLGSCCYDLHAEACQCKALVPMPLAERRALDAQR